MNGVDSHCAAAEAVVPVLADAANESRSSCQYASDFLMFRRGWNWLNHDLKVQFERDRNFEPAEASFSCHATFLNCGGAEHFEQRILHPVGSEVRRKVWFECSIGKYE